MLFSLPSPPRALAPVLLASLALAGCGGGSSDAAPEVVTPLALSAGGAHTAVLQSDGSLWLAGDNSHGQLGTGDGSDATTLVKVVDSGVTQVSAGFDFTAFVKTDGSVWVMGHNDRGQLGLGDTTDRSVPTQLLASGASAVAAGAAHLLVLKTDGSAWGTGANSGENAGSLCQGDADLNDHNALVTLVGSGVAQVAAGQVYSLLRKSDGSVWACGRDAYGQFGTDTVGSAATIPVQTVSGGVRAVVAGPTVSWLIKNDGSLWGAGYNAWGAVATGSTSDWVASYTQVLASGVADVRSNGFTTLVLRSDGTVWGVGRGSSGLFGNGDNSAIGGGTLQQVASGASALALGGPRYTEGDFSLLLTTGAAVQAAGANDQGQLGLGNTTAIGTWTTLVQGSGM